MRYGEEVLRRFRRPLHAAEPQERGERSGRAGSRQRGAEVELLLWLDPGKQTLERVRFRVFGCPHLVAAADLLAERLQGAPVAALGRVDAHELAGALAVPVEKLGRLLLLEDAARACDRGDTEP